MRKKYSAKDFAKKMFVSIFRAWTSVFLLPTLLLIAMIFPLFAQSKNKQAETKTETMKFPSTIDFYSLGLWNGIRPSKQFHFYMIEDFEQGKIWQVKSPQSGAVARLVPQEPTDKMPASKKEMTWLDHFFTDLFYTTESAQIDERSLPLKPHYSLEVMARVQHPGQENYRVIPPLSSVRYQKKVFQPIYSRPIEMSVWVKGYKRRQTLYALFRSHSGKTHKVFLGSLNFNGWRRLSAVIPYHVTDFRKGKDRVPWFWFGGFEIATEKSERSGFFLNMLDHVVILTDDYFSDYPGFEIKDDWQ